MAEGSRPTFKISGQVLDYWHKRGLAVARRLNEHGSIASCALARTELPDGTPLLQLSFEVDTFCKIVMAELAADALDEIRAEAAAKFTDDLADGEAN